MIIASGEKENNEKQSNPAFSKLLALYEKLWLQN